MSYTLNYGIFSPFKLAAKIEEETNQTEQPMLKTIEGIYQDGQIRFTEPPQDIGDRASVLVTFRYWYRVIKARKSYGVRV